MSKPQNEQEWREKCLELARLGVGPVARRLGNAMTPALEALMAYIDAARAAEAAQHQQEMSQQAAHIANLEHMVREHGQFGDLFQPGGRFHKDAQLEPGSVAVVAGGKWLVARLVAVEAERDNQYTQAVEATQRALLAEAERDRLKAALLDVTTGMDRAGGDRDGMPECPWCQSQGDYDHSGDCALVAARAALTPQGQSTDGETR